MPTSGRQAYSCENGPAERAIDNRRNRHNYMARPTLEEEQPILIAVVGNELQPMRRIAKVAGVVGAATALVLLAAPTAGAMPPVSAPISFTVTGDTDCGTFHDQFVDFFTGTETVFFDNAGTPVLDVIQFVHTSNDTNTVTGLTLHENDHFRFATDLLSGESTLTGAIIKVNFPGKGILIQDIGRIVYADGFGGTIVFEAGHHELLGLEGAGEQAFCAAFAALT